MPPAPKADAFAISRMTVTDDTVAPYLAPIVMRSTPVPVAGIGETVACDEQARVYFAPEYAARVDPATFNADMLHEWGGHLLGDHFARKAELFVSQEDEDLWAIATDAAINDGIVAAFAAKHPKAFKPGGQTFRSAEDREARKASGWIFPEAYNLPLGGTAETYFKLLKERREQEKTQQQQKAGQPQSGQGDGQGGGGAAQPIGSPPPPRPGQPQGQPSPGQAQGQAQGQGQKPVALPPRPKVGAGKCGECSGVKADARMEQIKAQAAAANGGTLPGGLSEQEKDTIRQEVAQQIVSAAQKTQGSVPAGLLRAAESILRPPKVDWRRMLRTLVRQGITGGHGDADWSLRRPRWKGDIGHHRLVAPKCRIAVVADTSGSMSESDLMRVLSETKALLRSDRVERVWWVPTDAKADRVVKLASIGQAKNNLVGGGGTNMGEGLDAVGARCRPRPHLTVVITDGFTGWPKVKPKGVGKVLVVLTQDDRRGDVPAWARVVVAKD